MEQTRFYSMVTLRHLKVILFILLSLFLLMRVSFGVIEIDSIEELQKIGNDPAYPLDGEYELTGDIDASETINWNDGQGFSPIGSEASPFIGTLDGKGYTITGLHISRPSTTNVGLFACIGVNSVIQNIKLESIYVIGYNTVGGLVGWNKGGQIQDCYSTGAVAGKQSNIGGLVGTNGQDCANLGEITRCYSTCLVAGDFYVGGLCGYNVPCSLIVESFSTGEVKGFSGTGGLLGSNKGEVRNCYSISKVIVAGWRAGGLVGENVGGGVIRNCYSSGLVSSYIELGGLVGWNDVLCLVIDSYWDKDTSGLSFSAGGTGLSTSEMKQKSSYMNWDFDNIWQINEGNSYPYFRWLGMGIAPVYPVVNVINVNNLDELRRVGLYSTHPWWCNYELTSDIDASETTDWDGGKAFRPLLLSGYFDGNGHEISNLRVYCPNEGYVGLFGWLMRGGEIRDLSMFNSVIEGVHRVGSVVGLSSGKVLRCKSIYGVISAWDGGYTNVGGIVGYLYSYGSISQSYSNNRIIGYNGAGGLVGRSYGGTTIIDNCFSVGNVVGHVNVGGLIGLMDSGVSLINSYSAGSIIGTTEYVGGLIGEQWGVVNITCSYWDINTSGYSTSAGGIGKTTARMKRQATFEGWDFVNTWGITEGVSYPYLRVFGDVPQLPIIEIHDLSELQGIGNISGYPLWGHYKLVLDIDASDTRNWNGGAGFVPIGTLARPFTGIFNGNGKVIQNLFINRPTEGNIGLFGHNLGQVDNLTVNNAQIRGQYRVGVITGRNRGVINKCQSSGMIIGMSLIGGMVGRNEGTILRSYSQTQVSGYYYYVGGIVGWNTPGIIRESYTVGDVVGYGFTGGLAGENLDGVIENCYSTGSVGGNNQIGGFVGQIRGSLVSEIRNCYSVGRVNGLGVDIGGFLGKYVDGLVLNSYWDVNTSGCINSADGEGLPTSEMKLQENYVGWNFETIWGIDEGVSYPYLRALGPTQEPPILTIDSLENLQDIGNQPAFPLWGRYKLSTDIDASDTVNWNSGSGFKPIGTEEFPFSGRFDGNYHVIRNLYINRAGENYVGLFGYAIGLEIKNLGVENAIIQGNNSVGVLIGRGAIVLEGCHSSGIVHGRNQVGGLVGLNEGLIYRCYSLADVRGTETYVGGLVGWNTPGTINECYAIGNVIGRNCVGGLSGENWSGRVMNSYSTGTVFASWDGGGFLGKTVGSYGEFIANCYSTGVVVSNGSQIGGFIGGIFGDNVQNCYWDMVKSGWTTSIGGEGKTTNEMKHRSTYSGWDFTSVWNIYEGVTYPYLRSLGPTQEQPQIEISSLEQISVIGKAPEYPSWGNYRLISDIDASDTVNWNGGMGFEPIGSAQEPFTGRFDGDGHVIWNLYINRADEDHVGLFGYILGGEVKNLGIENANIKGKEMVGVLVGKNFGVIKRCYSTGSIVGLKQVGGLVGRNEGLVFRSYSSVDVNGTNIYIGGLVGWNVPGIVKECYAVGDVIGGNIVGGLIGENWDGRIENSYAKGKVFGIWDVGGLAGSFWGGTITKAYNCYSTGVVLGSGGNIGGFLGRLSAGEAIGCYWDVQTSGQNSSAGGEGKSTAEMKRQITFVNWDFEKVWGIEDEVDYPYLLWEYGLGEEGEVEGIVEGEGVAEGEGNLEGSIEGTLEGEGAIEGEGLPEGEGSTEEGSVEGTVEGEGVAEGEGSLEGSIEGVLEGEGATEGEGLPEGEGSPEEGSAEGTIEGEGVAEGEGERPPHSADSNGDGRINLSELLRLIQFFNFGGYHCEAGTEDGYAPGIEGDRSCVPHSSDYNPQDWVISLSELLRAIQFFNIGGYHYCPGIGEDNYCPGR